MPVFNREELVGDAIRSIQDQTFSDWELVILDDGSTDGTLEVCRSFAAADRRIRVDANDRNLGLGETRKRLMSMGSGTYLLTHDSDDISVPERIEWSLEVLEHRPEIGLVTGICEWIDDEEKEFQLFPDILTAGGQYPQDKKQMARLLYQHCYVPITACMFRRTLGAFFPGIYRIVDDWHFLIRTAIAERIWGIPRVLVRMRRGQKHSHLWKDRAARLGEMRRLFLNIYRIYKKDPDSPIDHRLYRKTVAMWLAEESRFLPGWKGYNHALQSVLYDPLSRNVWKSIKRVHERAWKKATRQVLSFRNHASET
jgi:glycosyltransferase involved in cell wall biosynthesis